MSRFQATLPFLALLCFLQALPAISQSGSSIEISGTVTDSAGDVLSNATVKLVFKQTQAARVVQADSEGRFSFLQLSSGEYRLTAQADGFALVSEDVVYTGTPLRLALHLAPRGVASTVNVTADADALDPTAPARVAVTLEEIQRIPSQSVSSPLSSLITNTTPGVSADSNGSFHPLGDHGGSFVRYRWSAHYRSAKPDLLVAGFTQRPAIVGGA